VGRSVTRLSFLGVVPLGHENRSSGGDDAQGKKTPPIDAPSKVGLTHVFVFWLVSLLAEGNSTSPLCVTTNGSR